MATGCLSAARLPDIKGIGDFKGETYHTGYWPHEKVDFTGKRVAVIGTGSSAIQAIPVIAEEAAQVTVFQRTPNFSIPSRNAPMDAEYEQSWKSDYAAKRQQARMMRTGILYAINPLSALEVDEATRQAEYERRWENGGTAFMGAFGDLILNKASNDTASEFVRNKIRGIVKDPATAEALAPKDHPIGTKRICVDTNYYETYNRPNVALVNLRETPIETITASGIRTGGAGPRLRRHRLRHRLRRHDRRAAEDRLRGPRRAAPLGRMGARAAQLSRPDGRRLPQPVHDHRARAAPPCCRT